MSFFGDIAKGVIEGVVSPLFSWLNKKEDTDLEKFRVEGSVDQSLIQAHIALGVARINLLKDKWIISVQFIFGTILAIYYGKCVVYDKVLALGRTDPLTGDIQQWSLLIIGFLFGYSAIDRMTRKT